jgi:hypothetical protein
MAVDIQRDEAPHVARLRFDSGGLNLLTLDTVHELRAAAGGLPPRCRSSWSGG